MSRRACSTPTGIANLWHLLEAVIEGPLHPGGHSATEDLLDHATVGRETMLLDIGSGAGHTVAMARERGATAIGIDRRPRPSTTVAGDIRSLPFRKDRFDVVTTECVLCLSPNLERTLEEVGRVLRPGGRVAISDVTISGTPPSLPDPFDRLLCVKGPRDPHELRARIEDAGFEIRTERSHRGDLQSMRDQMLEKIAIDRIASLTGTSGETLHSGIEELNVGIDSGRIDYRSIVARKHSATPDGGDR